MPGALAEAETGEMGYLPTGGGHRWGPVWHQRWGKRSPGFYLSPCGDKAPTLPPWYGQSWWCTTPHGSAVGNVSGSNGAQRPLRWPDLLPREFCHLLGLGSGTLWKCCWGSSGPRARSHTTLLHGHLWHGQGRSGSCQEWLCGSGVRAKDMGVHWCLLGPAGEGEGLREEWMDSAVLRINKCLHSWCWK